MARRRSGLLDDIASLPWWAGLTLGIAVFFAIRHVLPWALGLNDGPLFKGLAQGLTQGPGKTLAWLAMLLCWLAAGASYLKGRHRRALYEAQSSNMQLASLNWRQFEQLVGEWFRRQGYQVEESGGGGPDGGVDLFLRKDGRREIVQCKHWRARHVPVGVVREMWGLLQHHHAQAAWIVCLGDFTPDAAAFAAGKPIQLVSGAQLGKMITHQSTQHSPGEAVADLPPNPFDSGCPKCGKPMLERRNGRTGEAFLGCTGYPACRGTRALLG